MSCRGAHRKKRFTVEDGKLEGVGGDEFGGDAAPVAAADHRDPVPGSDLLPVAAGGVHW